MKGLNFPVFKTKTPGVTGRFSLEDPVERKKYFEAKVGPEIEKLREYLRTGTFVGFLLGPKNSGKGTYTKLFMEAVGAEHITHISVGDVVRGAHDDLKNEDSKKDLIKFLEERYRGSVSPEEVCKLILGWGVSTPLLPMEAILALVEREISRQGKKAVFVDGFPRSLDQISTALYFRSLMGYRDDPDFFVFIDVPESVIDERIKHRVICPICHTPRSLKLLRTKEIKYNPEDKSFSLICDNPSCNGAIMVPKEGDELGIEPIRDRIEADGKVMKTLVDLHGIDKVYLRNSVPASKATEFVDDYELTPAYSYDWDEGNRKVIVKEDHWTVKDDMGEDIYSLLPAAVVMSLIKQIAEVLKL